MDLKGYVNPSSIGNKEPQTFLGTDLFIEEELWGQYVAHKKEAVQNTRTWDVTFAARYVAPFAIEHPVQKLVKIGRHAPCTIQVYVHPRFMALCVGLVQPVSEPPASG